MRCELVVDVEMAWFQRCPSRKIELIFHSDRGSQYASQQFQRLLSERGVKASMSRKANCWDNACSETLFGSLKVERLHGSTLKPFVRPRMKPSIGCSGITGQDCTPHSVTSAPSSTNKNGCNSSQRSKMDAVRQQKRLWKRWKAKSLFPQPRRLGNTFN
jgi:transposase InsO family protein